MSPSNPRSIPLAKPRKGNTATQHTEPFIEIPEDEKWRLINQSGILKKDIPRPSAIAEGDGLTPFWDEVFNAAMIVIPMSFLLLMMEILIHHQYGKQPSLQKLADRMIPGVPILSVLIFYTNRYKHDRRTQLLLFILSVLSGPRMVWLINRGNWLVNMQQCPPLATLWVYTIVQLDLGPAVLGLLGVGAWIWWKGLVLFH